ncbi:hypothetical protein DAI22_06g158700 [Oryza sativa Japonica Group]|nr:hypothetical protein DAI22_06g158700 [Oryza sativa Japonica Group]
MPQISSTPVFSFSFSFFFPTTPHPFVIGLRFGAWVTVVPLVALAGHRQQRRAQQQLDYDSTSLQTTGAGQQSAEAPGSAIYIS